MPCKPHPARRTISGKSRFFPRLRPRIRFFDRASNGELQRREIIPPRIGAMLTLELIRVRFTPTALLPSPATIMPRFCSESSIFADVLKSIAAHRRTHASPIIIFNQRYRYHLGSPLARSPVKIFNLRPRDGLRWPFRPMRVEWVILCNNTRTPRNYGPLSSFLAARNARSAEHAFVRRMCEIGC